VRFHDFARDLIHEGHLLPTSLVDAGPHLIAGRRLPPTEIAQLPIRHRVGIEPITEIGESSA